jgi:DNA-binding LacI/PurR family transcriptional regulator
MTHLFEQGYRNIGHITLGPLEWREAGQRMPAWEDDLIQAGFEATDNQWVEGNWSPENDAFAIAELIDQYPEIDAILAGNDQMALGAVQFAA